MRLIHPQVHRMLDFVTVLLFAVAPTIFGLTGVPRMMAYALAGIHLVLTLLTNFSSAGASPIPLRLHGVVEAIVGPVLIAAPFLLGWDGIARTFYVAIGVVILLVWLLSIYDHTSHAAH